MIKEALDIPHTPEGASFMTWWDDARRDDRNAVIKLALEHNISMLEARQKKEAIIEEID